LLKISNKLRAKSLNKSAPANNKKNSSTIFNNIELHNKSSRFTSLPHTSFAEAATTTNTHAAANPNTLANYQNSSGNKMHMHLAANNN
jgi:hypothetical protein